MSLIKMDQTESKRITKNLLFIKDNITQMEKIMDKLIEDECLGMDERADILTEKRADKQCHKLLDILLKRGGGAYRSFIEALHVSGNQHVASRIQQTDIGKDDTNLLHTRDDTFTILKKIEFEEAEVLQLYEEKEIYEDRVKELEVNCKILQNENSFKGHKIEKLKHDMRLLKHSVQAGYDEIDNADDTCVEHLRRLEEIETECEILEEENAHLKVVQRNLREIISEKETTMKNISQERQFYKRQMDTLQDELAKLRRESADKDSKIRFLNEQIRQLKMDLQNTRHAMDKMATDSKVAMEQMKTDHAKRFNQLDNKLDCVLKMLKTTAVNNANSPKSAESEKARMVRKQSIVSQKPEKPDTNTKKPKPYFNQNKP